MRRIAVLSVVLAALSVFAGSIDHADARSRRHGARAARVQPGPTPQLEAMIHACAKRYNMPVSLLMRVIREESGFRPSARNGPYWGLMQIRHDTARGVGYRGGPAGLLDAQTNLTYAGAYLGNAWMVSGGNERRAVSLFRGGYYYAAKRRGMLKRLYYVKQAQPLVGKDAATSNAAAPTVSNSRPASTPSSSR